MSTVNALMKKRQDDLDAEQERKDAESRAFLAQCPELIKQTMGEMYTEFDPYAKPGSPCGYFRDALHLPDSLEWRVEHPDFGELWVNAVLGLNPIAEGNVPVVKEIYFNTHSVINGRGGQVEIGDANQLADFFIRQAERTSAIRAKAREKKIGDLSHYLRVHVSQFEQEYMAQCVAQLVELDPDNAAAHQESYQTWLKRRAEWEGETARQREEDEKEAAAKAEKQEAEQAYWDALHEWDRERYAIRETNRKTLAELQAAYDQRFNLYELAFALTGRNDDGIPFAEVSTVYVLESAPREGGWWQVWDQGKQMITPMQFFTQVALVDRGEVAPSMSPAYLIIKPAGVAEEYAIRTTPWWWTRKEELLAKIEAAMQPKPALPDAAAFGLSENDAQRLTQQFLDVC